jgi:hypothetical protein
VPWEELVHVPVRAFRREFGTDSGRVSSGDYIICNKALVTFITGRQSLPIASPLMTFEAAIYGQAS